MPVDYDLVVIGSSVAGIHAAMTAANLKARVALVEQGCAAVGDEFSTRVLTEVGQTLYQMQRAAQLGFWDGLAFPSTTTVWEQATHWAKAAELAIADPLSPSVLSAMGIDVLSGCGEFHRKPALGFQVNDRSLRSRAYLLAIEQLPVVVKSSMQQRSSSVTPTLPGIDGLATIGSLNASAVLQKLPTSRTLHRLVIIGNDTSGVELAQSLARLGQVVTLIVSTPTILPDEDLEAAFLLQAQLEAEGVEVLTGTTVTQVRQIDQSKWVQAGNRAIEASEIILTTAPAFDWKPLNLEAANVKMSDSTVIVNAKLQTTNPRIYACRGLVNGAYTSQQAIADATIVLKNALFWAIATIPDRPVLSVIATAPPLARIGYTETSARQRFGKNVVVLRQPFKSLAKAQMQGETTGFCKLLVHRNGTLLGAHIVGSQAEELIAAIALAMQQKLSIQAIADLVLPASSLAEIIHQTAAEWNHLRWQQNTKWQDFLEGFFSWRRSQS
ncbi:MAG: NAD(P)/FAD-dependent oxidoreductase [Lyngbya sp. HA4199-MV5]|jgi:pyruvate/2-oxoglutarate dehydrogenase complex dihydrolipoamide dehydrogenase (E3) component|nr:NAD(P)/FAD-dependent oxidoreductase [Lyngbya sp. HA4199-MV5]